MQPEQSSSVNFTNESVPFGGVSTAVHGRQLQSASVCYLGMINGRNIIFTTVFISVESCENKKGSV